MKIPQDAINSLKNSQKFLDQSKDIVKQKENDEYIPDPENNDFMMNEPEIDSTQHQLKIYYRMGDAYIQLKDYFKAYEWV